MLEIDGYHFQLKNLNSTKTIKFWRCADATTLDDEFIRYSGKTTEHPHLTNPVESEIRKLRENIDELYDLFQHNRIT